MKGWKASAAWNGVWERYVNLEGCWKGENEVEHDVVETVSLHRVSCYVYSCHATRQNENGKKLSYSHLLHHDTVGTDEKNGVGLSQSLRVITLMNDVTEGFHLE